MGWPPATRPPPSSPYELRALDSKPPQSLADLKIEYDALKNELESATAVRQVAIVRRLDRLDEQIGEATVRELLREGELDE